MQPKRQHPRKRMPKRQPPKNSSWLQLTKDFVNEWPEVLEGLHFTNMPVTYLLYVNLQLKNNITINYNIKKEAKTKSQSSIAKLLTKLLTKHYNDIKSMDLKFDVPALKKDIQSKTSKILSKSFK